MTELQTTTISADTHLQGTLTFEGNAVILGKVDGKIIGSGEVTIGQQAQCKASIDASSVIVNGGVEGNIVARDAVQLSASARVTGDVVAQSISIAGGASFQGKVRISNSAPSSQEIETKLSAAESATNVNTREQAATESSSPSSAASTWAVSKPASLGAGLTSLGTSRSSWPNQR